MSVYDTVSPIEKSGIPIPFQLIYTKRGTIKDTFYIRGVHIKDPDGQLLCRVIVPDGHFRRSAFGWSITTKGFELHMTHGMLSDRICILQIRDPRAYVFVDPSGRKVGESVRHISGGIEVRDERGQTLCIHRTGFSKEQELVNAKKKPVYLFKLRKHKVQRILGNQDLTYIVTSEAKTRMDHRVLLSWVYFTFLEHTA
ncbi:MAG: hypothetical protein ACI9TH_001468 [Kiritimatiellia bacterium]|jgi:hypothetical protein